MNATKEEGMQSWMNGYGFKGEARIVERDGTIYLMIDQWDNHGLEGYAYRPYLYQLDTPKARTELLTILDDDWTNSEFRVEEILRASLDQPGVIPCGRFRGF